MGNIVGEDGEMRPYVSFLPQSLVDSLTCRVTLRLTERGVSGILSGMFSE